MAWRIEFDPAAEKELRKLGGEPARRILRLLAGRVSRLDDPRSVIRIGNRRDVYRR